MGGPGPPPTRTSVSRYTQELLTLSAQPAAAEQVLRIVSNPRAGAADVARVVETDPALAARVMRLANSPFYGSPRRVSSTRHATVMLGFDTVRAPRGRARRAACSTAGSSSGPTGSGATRSRPRRRRRSSPARSALSTADAFSAGLLHDLGAVLLHRRDAEAFAEATASPTCPIRSRPSSRRSVSRTPTKARPRSTRGASPSRSSKRSRCTSTASRSRKHALGRVLRVAEAVALEHAPMPGYPTPPDVDRLLLAIRLAARRLRRRRRARSTDSSNASPTCSESKRERRRSRDETLARLDAIQARSLERLQEAGPTARCSSSCSKPRACSSWRRSRRRASTRRAICSTRSTWSRRCIPCTVSPRRCRCRVPSRSRCTRASRRRAIAATRSSATA